jgi:hypothetical protein
MAAAQQCGVCKNPQLDAVSQCTQCTRGVDWDPSQGCKLRQFPLKKGSTEMDLFSQGLGDADAFALAASIAAHPQLTAIYLQVRRACGTMMMLRRHARL